MRIIIEIDSNNQTEIKKVSNEEPGTPLLTQSAPVDAGVANIPVQENINLSGSQDSIDDMNISSNATNVNSIDAGAYNASRSDSDSTMGLSPHENDLAMAVSSGSALDAGIPALAEPQWVETFSIAETSVGDFDRSNAMSAGEFKNS